MDVGQRIAAILGQQIIALAEKEMMIDQLQAKIKELETALATESTRGKEQ